jgi:hypothetical protein
MPSNIKRPSVAVTHKATEHIHNGSRKLTFVITSENDALINEVRRLLGELDGSKPFPARVLNALCYDHLGDWIKDLKQQLREQAAAKTAESPPASRQR